MRFTIRDLLWLTVVAAVAVAWWVDRSQLESQIANVGRTWSNDLDVGPTFQLVKRKMPSAASSEDLPSD
jgi:hypothetical protein